jgi:23S rRNA (adenine1618-N6)-methyltransferase
MLVHDPTLIFSLGTIDIMHVQNLHKEGYDFALLSQTYPAVAKFVIQKPDGGSTIDFSQPLAVKTLNAALLAHYYNIKNWDIPAGYLCPPVPGRADYIHHIADLLKVKKRDTAISGLDIGVGANAIYPIIGSQIYGWKFVGSEVDPVSAKSAANIANNNPNLSPFLSVRRQYHSQDIFTGIIGPQDAFTFTMCNPPFHASAAAASQASQRKNVNLARNKNKRQGMTDKPKNIDKFQSNFAGQHNELWCIGGELAFIQQMIIESKSYAKQVQWFTSLVSKKENLKPIYANLAYVEAIEIKTVNMTQGGKISRFVAWRFY